MFYCNLFGFVTISLRFMLFCRNNTIFAKQALSKALLGVVTRHFQLLQTLVCDVVFVAAIVFDVLALVALQRCYGSMQDDDNENLC